MVCVQIWENMLSFAESITVKDCFNPLSVEKNTYSVLLFKIRDIFGVVK